MIQYALAILAIAVASVYLVRQLLKRRQSVSCCSDPLMDCRGCAKKSETARRKAGRD